MNLGGRFAVCREERAEMSMRKRTSRGGGSRSSGGEGSGRGDSRHARQLCKQVGRALDQIIMGELDDDALRGVGVHSVVPAPDESRLLVTVGPMAPGIRVDPGRVLASLAAHSVHLRSEVAASITRRKTPALQFQVHPLPPGAETEEAEQDDSE